MKLSKTLKDIFGTGLTQIVVVLASVIILNLAARLLSKEYFGLFMVIRRWVPVLIPLMTLNFSVGLTRYVGYDPENSDSYLLTASRYILCIAILSAVLFSIFSDTVSLLLFNDTHFSYLVHILLLFLIANSIHLLVYGYYRGRLLMLKANGLKILFMVFPILILV